MHKSIYKHCVVTDVAVLRFMGLRHTLVTAMT